MTTPNIGKVVGFHTLDVESITVYCMIIFINCMYPLSKSGKVKKGKKKKKEREKREFDISIFLWLSSSVLCYHCWEQFEQGLK